MFPVAFTHYNQRPHMGTKQSLSCVMFQSFIHSILTQQFTYCTYFQVCILAMETDYPSMMSKTRLLKTIIKFVLCGIQIVKFYQPGFLYVHSGNPKPTSYLMWGLLSLSMLSCSSDKHATLFNWVFLNTEGGCREFKSYSKTKTSHLESKMFEGWESLQL